MKVNQLLSAFCIGLLPFTDIVSAPVEQRLKFTTAVPADSFSVVPAFPWPEPWERLLFHHDATTGKFYPYWNDLKVTSEDQHVTARLQNPATLVDGANVIPLQVEFDDKVLDVNPQQIHSKSPTEATYRLTIGPKGSSKEYPAGKYAGDVVLIFEGA